MAGTPSRGYAPRKGELRQKHFLRTKLRAREMRKEPTIAEAAMWKLLRSLNTQGAHFRRQIAVAHYVFDFGDYSARLLIEVDGAVHELEEVRIQDHRKEAHAHANGFRLLRFTNAEVCGRRDWVMSIVRAALSQSSAPSSLVEEGREEGRSGFGASGAAERSSDRPSPPNPLSTRERGKEEA